MIHPDSYFYKIYNLLLSLVLLLLVITIPFEINDGEFLESNSLYFTMLLTFEGLFVIDIILNFITIIEDDMGYEITDMDKVCWNYMSAWFIIDLISSIPINILKTLKLITFSGESSITM